MSTLSEYLVQCQGNSTAKSKYSVSVRHHVTHLLVQICNAELTAGHSELKYWVYFSTFCDVDFYT